MKIAVELFTLVMVVTVSCIMFASMISIAVQNADARDYYNTVRNRVEDSNYNNQVIRECEEEASQKGYILNVRDVTVDTKNPSKLMTMEYNVSIPVYKIFGKSVDRKATIEGYAR